MDTFYDILFNHKKIVSPTKMVDAVTDEKWTGSIAVFCAEQKLDEPRQKLLQGIMSACQFKDEDWEIFPNNTGFRSLAGFSRVKYVFLFGCPEKNLGITAHFQFHKAISFNGKTVIKTYSLSELIAHPDYKKRLWNDVLKPVFS